VVCKACSHHLFEELVRVYRERPPACHARAHPPDTHTAPRAPPPSPPPAPPAAPAADTAAADVATAASAAALTCRAPAPPAWPGCLASGFWSQLCHDGAFLWGAMVNPLSRRRAPPRKARTNRDRSWTFASVSSRSQTVSSGSPAPSSSATLYTRLRGHVRNPQLVYTI
jgi:hypothetical protein